VIREFGIGNHGLATKEQTLQRNNWNKSLRKHVLSVKPPIFRVYNGNPICFNVPQIEHICQSKGFGYCLRGYANQNTSMMGHNTYLL